MPLAPLQTRQILVVDDDSSIREMIGQALEDEGFRVSSAADGSQALEYLKHNDELPCLIVLDLKMPIMDGAEFRMRQQQDARLSPIPVVLLTADQNHAQERAKMGIVNVLNKPVKLGTLLDTVQRLVH
jgi:CheY-like chemotaxis protein